MARTKLINYPILEKKHDIPSEYVIVKREDWEKINKPKTRKVDALANTLMSEVDITKLSEKDLFYYKIAEAFRQLFMQNLKKNNLTPTHQLKAKYKDYVTPIKRMIEIDKIKNEQIKVIYTFLKGHTQRAEFWKPNILSTSKLRKQAQKLYLAASKKTYTPNAIKP